MKVTYKLFKKLDNYIKCNYKSVSRYPLINVEERLEREKLFRYAEVWKLKIMLMSGYPACSYFVPYA